MARAAQCPADAAAGRNEYATDLERRAAEYHEEECPVCLDVLGEASDVMHTKCGHTYHYGCIIETLYDGTIRSCPLCRTDIRHIADHSACSGQVFSFNCLLRIAFDRIQASTKCFKKHVEEDLAKCTLEIKALRSSVYMKRFQKSRWRKAEQNLSSLIDDIHALERAGAANVLGFQDLCAQLPRICGPRTAEEASHYVAKLDCYRDAQVCGSCCSSSYSSLRQVAIFVTSGGRGHSNLSAPAHEFACARPSAVKC